MEPSQVNDLLVLSLRGAPEMRKDPLPVRARHTVEAIDVEEVDELLVVNVFLLAPRYFFGDLFRQTLLSRHMLGVAAQQNVGAAAGHVRGDRDVVLAPGLRDDLGLLRVVLRVQDDVLDAALAQQRREAL